MDRIAMAVREKMGEMGMGAEDFADYIGVSTTQVRNWLRGRNISGLSGAAEALCRKWPELLPLFLPEEIAQSVSVVPSGSAQEA